MVCKKYLRSIRKIETAFLFTDGTAAELLSRIDAVPVKKVPEIGALLADQWNGVLRNLAASFEIQLVHDVLSNHRETGFFYAAVSAKQLTNFDVLYDPRDREQVFVGALGYQNNRAFFDTWTSFPSRSIRNGAQPPAAAGAA